MSACRHAGQTPRRRLNHLHERFHDRSMLCLTSPLCIRIHALNAPLAVGQRCVDALRGMRNRVGPGAANVRRNAWPLSSRHPGAVRLASDSPAGAPHRPRNAFAVFDDQTCAMAWPLLASCQTYGSGVGMECGRGIFSRTMRHHVVPVDTTGQELTTSDLKPAGQRPIRGVEYLQFGCHGAHGALSYSPSRRAVRAIPTSSRS